MRDMWFCLCPKRLLPEIRFGSVWEEIPLYTDNPFEKEPPPRARVKDFRDGYIQYTLDCGAVCSGKVRYFLCRYRCVIK